MLPDQKAIGPFRYARGRPIASSSPQARKTNAATIATPAPVLLATNRRQPSNATDTAATIDGGTSPSSTGLLRAAPELPDPFQQLPFLRLGTLEDSLRVLGIGNH